MLTIPLAAEPSQTLQVVLDGQNVQLSIYTKLINGTFNTLGFLTDATLFMDVALNNVPIATTRLCLNDVRVLHNAQYSAFVGDFVFVDTQGNSNPQYAGLGTRYQLVYLQAADL